MADWTKKKLHIGCQNDAIYILDGSPSPAPYDGPVPRADGPEVVATPNWRHSNYQANADRLVACWNACLDMNDPAAEIAALRAENERLRWSADEDARNMAHERGAYAQMQAAYETAEARVKELEEALCRAEKMFRWYGNLHSAKTPPDIDKAKRNYDEADACLRALGGTSDEG